MADIPHGFIKGKVLSRTDWTDKLFSLQIAGQLKPYLAGQFAKLALPDEQGEWLRRAYSIVNSPGQSQHHQQTEYLVITDPAGQLSPRLQQLAVGDEVYLSETTAGFMTLEEVPPNVDDLWLLATGSAIGPFLAMLASPLAAQYQHLILVHAVRTAEELVYQQHIQELLKRYQGKLTYIPVVSRQHHEGALSGRIPALLSQQALQQAAGLTLNAERSFVYLCGNPAMVKDGAQALTDLGLSKHLRRQPGQFSSENYW
ncbi:ferredoxin--NADP reductase [Motilimonas pumila]|uniref:ferredoxin--NADP(+) reductase n=1 Tax=Motilimonas pumila TaxID=2303987 RepID=A0A418YE74_9GAMM|nr:ferredoxin--NADP reductase [Motilimonas pumila]RJG47417.1 ferredoxin--NADP reductase [Motilimonas pumila]